MIGVEILNTTEVITKTVFSWDSFWWGVLIGAIIGSIMTVFINLEDWDWEVVLLMWIVAVLLCGVLLGLLGGFVVAPTPVEHETHYDVTISEDVSMPEFLDRYEILETNGKILTIREKK